MELTFEKLLEFDLIDELDCFLVEQNKHELLMDFINTSQDIQGIDRFIKEAPSFPGSAETIIRSELISAIGATLAIEGTKLGDEEIEESFRKAKLSEKLRRQQQEAENSRKVYTFIVDIILNTDSTFVYRESIIKQMHKYFTYNMNYLGNKPGAYRGDYPATFGVPRRSSLCRTQQEVNTAMAAFVRWLNKTGTGILSTHVIVKAIMAHYYLTEIHPFADGNGRTARALEALVLYVNGVNTYCFWALSNFWSTHRDQYIMHLGDIRDTCKPWDFLIWGMKGYLHEITRIKNLVLKKVKQLMLMDYTKYLVDTKNKQKVKLNTRIVDVLRILVRLERISFSKFQSSPEVQALYKNVSATTKYRDFKKMEQNGLIKFTTEHNEPLVEPNYQILGYVNYRV